MKIFDRIEQVDLSRPVVAVLGNFDGVHRGHQQLLAKAREAGGRILLVTFDPHPMTYMGHEVHLLQTLEEKLRTLESFGIDGVLILTFDQRIASMDKKTFVREILVDQLNAKTVVVGYNYHFGKGAEGKSGDIVQLGVVYGFSGLVVPAFRLGDHVVSSSLIRHLISSGKMTEAAELMGHPYTITGTVVHGQGLGKTLGFPTANLETDGDKLLPKSGVYSIVGEVHGLEYMGFCNVGYQPTFRTRTKKLVVEVHFFGFDGDIYGESIQISFVEFLRPVKRFDSVEQLVEELYVDKEQAVRSIEKKSFS